jgi:hypothetical protein
MVIIKPHSFLLLNMSQQEIDDFHYILLLQKYILPTDDEVDREDQKGPN